MNTDLTALKPALVWKHFAAMTQIPRPSFHEEKIRRYVMDTVRSLGLECREDAAHNVYVRKPASKGMEDRAGVILQAHLDMVPQKNNDKKFDFLKDSIQAYVDGGWGTADGTTLGADNGIGAAAILAVLEDDTLEHGPLEALFTATEETGMAGAFGLKKGLLKGDILLNLDSETEGELYVGCAGGLDANIKFRSGLEPTPARNYTAAALTVKGLKGGHSGIQIICQRANANKLLFRLLRRWTAAHDLLLCSVDGGGLRNAIPREATATVLVRTKEFEAFQKEVHAFEKLMKAEFAGIEESISIKAKACDRPSEMISKEVQGKLICAVAACPDGLQRMSLAMPGLVQTSTNLARGFGRPQRAVAMSAAQLGQLREGGAGRRDRRGVRAGGRQGRADGQLRRLESRYGLSDSQGDDRLLRAALRPQAGRHGDPCGSGVRCDRRHLSQARYDLVRPHDLLSSLARREGRDRVGGQVL